jgi:hypothetical protein
MGVQKLANWGARKHSLDVWMPPPSWPNHWMCVPHVLFANFGGGGAQVRIKCHKDPVSHAKLN